MRSSAEQIETCFHEAGHAVVAVTLGQKFGYVSMRPRDRKRSVAHVWTPSHISAYAIYQRGHWKAHASISAAGIIAEELYTQENYWFLKHSRLKWMPSDSWFADVELYATMRRQHEAEVAARCPDCGCSPVSPDARAR